MKATGGRFTSGSNLRQYLLIEKLSDDPAGAVWKAQDTVLGRPASVKILRPEVTADTAQRELVTSEARAAAKLDHPAIAKIYELDRIDEDMFIAFEYVEGQPLHRLVRDKPLGRDWFLRIAEPLADALHTAHAVNVVHGNLHGWDVLVAEDGRVKVAGFGTGRASSSGEPVQNEIDSADQAYYFSPERILGRPPDPRSDVFSLGVILYEMATGRVPFPGDSPAAVCDRIVNAPPPAPQLYNPSVDPAIVNIIGRCIQKDPGRRYPHCGAVHSDLRKVSEVRAKPLPAVPAAPPPPPPEPSEHEAPMPIPAAVTAPPPVARDQVRDALNAALAQLDNTVAGGADDGTVERLRNEDVIEDVPAHPSARRSVILFASLPPSPTPSSDETGSSARLPGIMQQILGEAVYLNDGQIVDPFGSRMIAEFGSARQAVLAAKKGKEDLESYNLRQFKRALHIHARLVIHEGEVWTEEGTVVGPAVDAAGSIAMIVPPLTPLISGGLLRAMGLEVPPRAMVSTGGSDFFPLPREEEINPPAPEPPPSAETVVAPRRRSLAMVVAVSVIAVLLIGGSVAAFAIHSSRRRAAEAEAQRLAAEAKRLAVKPVPTGPRAIAVDAFTAQVTDTAAPAPPTETIRFATIGLLDAYPAVMVTDGPEAGDRFSAVVRQGPEGTQIVPVRRGARSATGPPMQAADVAEGARIVADWIAGQLNLPPTAYGRTTSSGMELFAEAVREHRASGGTATPRLAEVLRTLTAADPTFLPAQLMALDTFEVLGDHVSAVAAADAILALEPRNIEIQKRAAKLMSRTGAPSEALAHFGDVLKAQPKDVESLTAVGLYALAANDPVLFNRILGGGTKLPALHPPDTMLVNGRIDQAAAPLFDLEVGDQSNAALALKIGRVAVLRRMMTIANIELGKLRQLDPSYGHPMLNAYILAEAGRRSEAMSELDRAIAGARWSDQPYTSAAEVHAIMGDTRGTLDALEKAVARGEPTGSYILHHPLFRYLESDARYRRLRARIEQQIGAIRALLPTIPV
jgi:serine/threonine protein kinase/tetratricopeptide (TPR) repeat protein